MEAVKIDQKAMQQEKEALKKLANVKQDHLKRLQDLSERQKNNILQGQLIGTYYREHQRERSYCMKIWMVQNVENATYVSKNWSCNI